MKRLAMAALLALTAAACGKPRVVTQPDLPPLAAPAPPPRVVMPPEPEQEPEPPAKQPETQVRKPVRPPVRSGGEARDVRPPETSKPVTKPDPVPPVREDNPLTTLQTLPPKTQAELDRHARGLIFQAEKDLNGVHYKTLNADARGQYDQAKRFIDQARQALKEQNSVLAQRLAEKAATIAGVLVGR